MFFTKRDAITNFKVKVFCFLRSFLVHLLAMKNYIYEFGKLFILEDIAILAKNIQFF